MSCGLKKFVVGDKVKVVGVSSGHGSPIGTILTFKSYYNNNTGYMVSENGSWYGINDLDYTVIPRECLVKKIEARKADAERVAADVALMTRQLGFLDETGQQAFDDNEFKAYYTLKVLEKNDLTTLERAKAIASLFAK